MLNVIKDWLWIVVTVAGGLWVLIKSIWWIVFKIKTHSKQLEEHGARIEQLEDKESTVNHNLSVLNTNLVKIMEHLNIEPAKNLIKE